MQDEHVEHKQGVRSVYERMAAEYDDRIPGRTPADARFMETETEFVLERIAETDEVLDIGCGTGRFTLPIARRAARTVGFDLSPAMLEVTRARAASEGLVAELVEGDMANLPFPDDSFDVVVSMLALMHIPVAERQRVFCEVARVLKPGGRFLIGVKNALFERLSRADRFVSVDVTDIDNGELVFTDTQAGPEFRAPWRSFAPQELTALGAMAGLTVTTLRGNCTLTAWLSDAILAEDRVYSIVRAAERALGDVPPLNHLGYHLLAEANKPLAGA